MWLIQGSYVFKDKSWFLDNDGTVHILEELRELPLNSYYGTSDEAIQTANEYNARVKRELAANPDMEPVCYYPVSYGYIWDSLNPV